MKSFMTYYAKNAKVLKIYIALTLLAWLIDLGSFFAACHKFNTSDTHDAYPATILFIFGIVYVCLDTYYIWWCLSLKLKLPSFIFRPVFKALGGLGDSLVGALQSRINRQPPA